MRRVKKTTIEQFDLLKAEMALHPAAARGYGVGAQRAIVDAEWKEIVEKLNALGPPERTMTEWKKVWSDLRLRSIKRLSEEFTPKPKKIKYKSKKNKLVETICGSDSIYASYGDLIKPEQTSFSSPTDMDEESQKEDEESYKNPLAEDEFDNTEQHYYNSSNDDNSYEVNYFEEEDVEPVAKFRNNSNNYNYESKSKCDVRQGELSTGKQKYLRQTLSIIMQQMKNQNQIVEHLTKITSNLAMLMENHVTNMEKQNKIIEKQLKTTASQNICLKRQEARRTILSRYRASNFQKS